MKEILVLFVLAITYSGMDALKEGVITYEQKINLHRRLPDPEMKNMVPEFQTYQTQLFFTENETLYKPIEEEEDEEVEAGGGGMRMRFRRPTAIIYRHLANNQKLEQIEFMGKNYLIEGTNKQMPWKVTGEMEKVAGYNCMKATLKDSTNMQPRKVLAWFTTDIPVAVGPDRFGALPGLILKIDVNDGEVIYMATKIDARPLKKGEIEIPTKGKKMPEDEFRKMMEEEMKKMGGPGNRMIIRN